MQETEAWKDLFQKELQRAEAARSAGHEGMARVCARRAAGIIAGEYLKKSGLPSPGPSAYDRLRYLQKLPSLPVGMNIVIQRFLERVTPEHKLPFEADLIAEARWLAHTLLKNG